MIKKIVTASVDEFFKSDEAKICPNCGTTLPTLLTTGFVECPICQTKISKFRKDKNKLEVRNG